MLMLKIYFENLIDKQLEFMVFSVFKLNETTKRIYYLHLETYDNEVYVIIE